MVALPVAVPPPREGFPCMPHDQAEHLDLVLVLLVVCLTVDFAGPSALDLEEHVPGAGGTGDAGIGNSHLSTPTNRPCWPSGRT